MTEIRARIGLALVLLLCTTRAQASVEISSAPTQNMNCSAGVCTPKSKSAVLNVNDLTAMLATQDVKIITGHGAVTITVFAPFSWTSTHRLTLDAYGTVSFRAPVTVSGPGAVTIVTNAGGDYRFLDDGHLEFWSRQSKLIINGVHYILCPNVHILKKDVHTNPAGFYALARSSDDQIEWRAGLNKVEGIVEGLGNTISNISIGAGPYAAFIRTNTGIIRDIKFANAKVTNGGGYILALLVANNFGTVLSCAVSGELEIIPYAGNVEVVGGLAGSNSGSIRNSSAALTLNDPETKYSGCYYCGGLVGYSYGSGSIEQSFASGVLSVAGGAMGGLVGEDDASTTDSYAMVELSNGGQAQAAAPTTGGATGRAAGGTHRAIYSIGHVAGESGYPTGGLIGSDNGTMSNDTYWDLETSGVSDPSQGAGNVSNDPGITGLTDAQLKSGLPAGFDPKIWAQSAGVNNGYPYLINNPPQ